MGVLAIPFPEIDPVALRLGPLSVKWYGLAYMAGLLLGWLYVKYLLRQGQLWPHAKRPFPPDKADDLLLYMTVGVLVGGRLGNVLFYEPAYYLQNPLEIPAVWKGGMAFHGGLIGCIIAIVLFARRNCDCTRRPRWRPASLPTASAFGVFEIRSLHDMRFLGSSRWRQVPQQTLGCRPSSIVFRQSCGGW